MDAINRLIEQYRLTDHSNTIFYFAGIFRNRIESLNKNYFFDRDKRLKGYNKQYSELRKYLKTTTPDSIKLSFGGKQIKLFEGTPKEETSFFLPNELEITNKILIDEILFAVNGIQQPKVKPISDTSRQNTFRPLFLQSTRPLYDYLKDNKVVINKHRFICELIKILGFDWQESSDPVRQLQRQYKIKPVK